MNSCNFRFHNETFSITSRGGHARNKNPRSYRTAFHQTIDENERHTYPRLWYLKHGGWLMFETRYSKVGLIEV